MASRDRAAFAASAAPLRDADAPLSVLRGAFIELTELLGGISVCDRASQLVAVDAGVLEAAVFALRSAVGVRTDAARLRLRIAWHGSYDTRGSYIARLSSPRRGCA